MSRISSDMHAGGNLVLRLRTALLFGVLFEMTVKPEAGVVAMVAIGLVGLVWGIATRS